MRKLEFKEKKKREGKDEEKKNIFHASVPPCTEAN
jgi:hypothetical protein